MHPECYRAEGVTREELETRVHGLDALKDGDREVLLATVLSPDRPEIENTALDVTSEEFLRRPAVEPMEAKSSQLANIWVGCTTTTDY